MKKNSQNCIQQELNLGSLSIQCSKRNSYTYLNETVFVYYLVPSYQ